MSYIRSTSNPENLYVFGSSRGIEWYVGITCFGGQNCTMPPSDFEAIMLKWYEEGGWDNTIEVNGISISETEDGRNRVKYGDFDAVFYDVTLEHIARRVVSEQLRAENIGRRIIRAIRRRP